MTNLAIGRLDLPDEGAWLRLSGVSNLPGLISSDYDFQPTEEERTKETIKIRLRGSLDQLRLWLDHLENFQRLVPEVFLRSGKTIRRICLSSRSSVYRLIAGIWHPLRKVRWKSS